LGAVSTALAAEAAGAVALRLDAGGASSQQVVSNLALHVEPGTTPDPFLPPGPFTATWEGDLNVDLRGDFQFRVESSGPFQLELGGSNVLASTPSTWSPPVRLRKGPNPFRAVFHATSTEGAAASARLLWQGRGLPEGPVPASSLTPSQVPASNPAGLASRPARGRGLFLELRCGRCHVADVPTPVPELEMDAPPFAAIGPGRDPHWLEQWLLDPQATRSRAVMPRLLHGPEAPAEAAALAAWLTSLPIDPPTTTPAPSGSVPIGRSLSESLRCSACHVLPGEPADPARIALAHVAVKFAQAPDALGRYLMQPSALHRWSRMPDYGLSRDEAAHLAAWLLAGKPAAGSTETTPPTKALVEMGAHLAQTRGCVACHEPRASRPPHARPLRDLPASAWKTGCLSETPPRDPPATARPWYALSPEQRADLQAFAQTDRSSLGRHVPSDFAARWSDTLRCGGCHEGVEGIPGIAGAGAKLKPEWMGRLLRGEILRKARPWLPARMPAFPAFADGLAMGLASQHGLAPRTPAEPPLDAQAAADGRRLVSASGGFACVSCHAIGPAGATAVFEAPGINFSLVEERLQPGYFGRWIRNPQLVEPGTKMPQYFDEEGNSALADYADGDGPKTIHALWSYLRLGGRMEPPPP
jgi:mono/diheme cytochrome c family protein